MEQNQNITLSNLTVDEFLATTASNAPVPGGGSVAALCGALAAALGEMVAGLTIGRKKYADVNDRMTQLAAEFDDARRGLLALADVDANSYRLVMEAYKLPKETDSEKRVREETIQKTLRVAASTPLSVARAAQGMMAAIAEVARTGNQNAVTDACVAMMAARTAVLGAVLNVRINLQSMTDTALVGELSAECDKLWAAAIDAETRLLSSIKI